MLSDNYAKFCVIQKEAYILLEQLHQGIKEIEVLSNLLAERIWSVSFIITIFKKYKINSIPGLCPLCKKLREL